MHKNVPQLSIGLPVYNGEKYLAATLDSLLAQTYTNFELIISDNGSTDTTQQICQQYCTKDSRVRYYRSETNQGATWNYNRVFALAVGRYFKWAAADDLCEPYFLERCIEILEQKPEVILAFSKVKIIDANGQFVGHYPSRFNLTSPKPEMRLQDFLRARGLCNPIFGVLRRVDLLHTGLIESYVASDRVLLGKLALKGQLYEVPEYLFLRREHPQSSVHANRAYQLRIAWFDPQKRRGLPLPRWRWFYEYMAAIQRTPMPLLSKLNCYKVMARRYLLRPGWMLKDLKIAIQETRRQNQAV